MPNERALTMLIRLSPADPDRDVWRVLVHRPEGEVLVDYTRLRAEQRSFIGDEEALVDASPDADGWDIKALSPSLG